jgi:two-component system, LytTR family, response regulator LytT
MTEPMRVLVLEDEWPARNFLTQLVEKSGLAHVVAAVASPALASEALASTPSPIDIAFVDIHLAGEIEPERAGLTWIESLAQAHKRGEPIPKVVLTTASKEHAMRAYELGVVDYLLKPFTETRVRESLQRVSTQVRTAPQPTAEADIRIAARKGRSIVFLERARAHAFEAEGRLCYVHTDEGRLDIDLSLSSLQTVLGASYLRVHRNWLVSTLSVKSMEREDSDWVLTVGDREHPLRIHVARDRATAIRERLLASAIGLRTT